MASAKRLHPISNPTPKTLTLADLYPGLKVGSKVWRRPGWVSGSVRDLVITGETKRSWLIKLNNWTDIKLNKKAKPDRYGFFKTNPVHRGHDTGYPLAITLRTVKELIWCQQHGRDIAARVPNLPYDTLSKVAELIGYPVEVKY